MVNSNSAGGPGGVALFEDEGGESENSIWPHIPLTLFAT